jgi:tetraacyldisaccharide-1-P 4'-kinase
MGKNTMMKRSIREHAKRTKNEEWLVRSGVAEPETLFAALRASSPLTRAPPRRAAAG